MKTRHQTRRFNLLSVALLLILMGCDTPNNGLVSIKGTVGAINLGNSQFGVSLTLDIEEGRTRRVWLGSVRFLIEQDFVPTSGELIEVTGYEAQSDASTPDIVATSIRSTSGNRLLVLPDTRESGEASR